MNVTLSLGSNIGDKAENLRLAVQLLGPTVSIRRISSFYQTEPWGYADQDPFYNVVLNGETDFSPEDLLKFIKQIERRMGRTETFRNGPRVIDIDILFYDDLKVESEVLTIPHPRYRERRFVLAPLVEILPDGADPIHGDSFVSLLEIAPPGAVRRLTEPQRLSRPVLRWGVKTYVMGIVNLTPDSFSQDGIYRDDKNPEIALARALAQSASFLTDGAEILDLGAESTRPGYRPVPEAEETARLIEPIRAIRARFPDALLSVDTMKAATAEAAVRAGADWINDVGGGTFDPRMIETAVASDCPIVLMRSETLKPAAPIADQAIAQLSALADRALRGGVKPDRIILDPGIGFGASAWDNLEIMRALPLIRARFDFPLLLGPSRKSLIGKTFRRAADDRLGGTSALVSAAIQSGFDIVRVHDVNVMAQTARMSDLIAR